MVIRRCTWHRRYVGYPMVCGVAEWSGAGLRFSDWMCRRCAIHVRQALGHSGVAMPPDPPAAIRWDPVVLAPPAAALLAVLAMVLMVTNPIDHASPGPAPVEHQRDVSALTAPVPRPLYAWARKEEPPRAKATRPQTTFRDIGSGTTLRAEARSVLFVVPAHGPLELRSVQAP